MASRNVSDNITVKYHARFITTEYDTHIHINKTKKISIVLILSLKYDFVNISVSKLFNAVPVATCATCYTNAITLIKHTLVFSWKIS